MVKCGWAFPAVVATILLAALLSSPGVSADTRNERVKKFQTSLGEQVVRDSGRELPGEEKRSVLLRAAGLAAAAVALLVAASVLLSRLRARRSRRENALRYLTENLLTPQAVREHLQRVASTRTPLYLWIDDHFIKFSSHAVTLSSDGETLSVSPVTPASGNEMLRGSRRVRVEYLHQKVPYHFDAPWREERGDAGSFVHLLALPERIQFTQRREHYRVEPSLGTPVAFRAANLDAPPMGLLDVGMGGFSVATSARVRAGEAFAECRIEGEGMLPIECSARCVYESPLPENTSKHRFRYGFTVTRLGEGNGKRLSRFIAQRQLADLSRRKAMES